MLHWLVDSAYLQTVQEFRGAIVDAIYQRAKSPLWSIAENLSYWSRKGTGEFKVSGLPVARSIFTYAGLPKTMVVSRAVRSVLSAIRLALCCLNGRLAKR